MGQSDFKKLNDLKEKSPSPKTKTKEEILAKIIFCKKEIGLLKAGSNHRMVGFKLEEIKTLEKKL